MPKRNSPQNVRNLEDLNNLQDLVYDKRNHKRSAEKKNRRDRHYKKQFIKNSLIQFNQATIQEHLEDENGN